VVRDARVYRGGVLWGQGVVTERRRGFVTYIWVFGGGVPDRAGAAQHGPPVGLAFTAQGIRTGAAFATLRGTSAGPVLLLKFSPAELSCCCSGQWIPNTISLLALAHVDHQVTPLMVIG